MKNLKVEYFFNVKSSKDNTFNDINIFKNKFVNNNQFKNKQNISYENNESLKKFHRPLSTTIYSNNIKEIRNKKGNDFLKQNIYSNNNINTAKSHNLYSLNINHILQAFNGNNTYKLVNFHQKINGKKLEEFLLKNIISLPQIKSVNKKFFGKNSIAIINHNQENKNNLKNINYQNYHIENGNKTQLFDGNKLHINNNNMLLTNFQNDKIIKYFINKNINENKNDERRNFIVKNVTFLKKNLFDSNNNNYNNNNKKDNRYNNTNNAILLKTITNCKLSNTNTNLNNNSLLNSYQPPTNYSLETKKFINYNLINSNENLDKNKLIKTKENDIEKYNYIDNNNNIRSKMSLKAYNQKNNNNNNTNLNNDINNNYFLKEEFLEKLNNVRKIYKEREIKKHNLKCFYYLILPGNASYLVENCMNHRINWVKPYSIVSSLYNFKWQELSYGIDYSSLGHFQNVKQIVNHFENHFVISNKAKMFTNLLNYCEKRKLSVFKYVPFTIIFQLKDKKEKEKEEENKTNYNTYEKTKNKNKEEENNNNKYEKLKDFINKIEKYVKNYDEIGNYYEKENYKKYKKNKENNEINKNINSIDFKKSFYKRKFRLYKKIGKRNHFSYVTERKKENQNENEKEDIENENIYSNYTLYSEYFNNLLEDNSIPIYDKNKERKFEEENNIKTHNKNGDKNINEQKIIGSNTLIEIPTSHFSGKNMWVVKAINLNRGMCIRIVNNYEQMLQIINKFKEGVDYNFTKENIEENEIKSTIKSNKNYSASPLKRSRTNNINIMEKQNLIKYNIKQTILNSADKNNNNNNNINLENTKNKIEENKKTNEKEEKLYNCNKIIIQKYIENPLLYNGRKCDMRIWVLLTYTMKVYVFKEGHLKTCSIEYNLNSKDAFAHITNYSFQKYNTNFQKYEKGNEVPFYEFQKFINEKYSDKKYSIKKHLLSQIKEIVKITMLSVKDKINKNNRNFQFEIYGYDFMMDKDFNLFLIEINTNPGLEESSPWIKLIVPRMLDDALRLTIDQLFETKYDFSVINKNKTKEEINNYRQLLNNYNENIDINGINTSSSLTIKSAKNKIIYRNNDNGLKENDIYLKTIPSTINEDNKDIEEENNKNNNNKDNNENKHNKENNNTIKNKNKKYISPFPIPGYTLDENIWDFVCDLNDPDPFEGIKEENEEEEENTNEKNKRKNIYNFTKRRKNKKSKKKNKKLKRKKNNEDELNKNNE